MSMEADSNADEVIRILDDQLDKYAHRLAGAVVLITGGANGIGRKTALRCAKHGAKIVIGDLDLKGAEEVCSSITSSGGQVISVRCDVTVWEDQVALFDAALQTFGKIDIVLANAGVTEHPGLGELQFMDGKPIKPDLLTTSVNTIGILYTTHLALHHLRESYTEGALKSLIYMASTAGVFILGGAPQYTASKHGVVALMRTVAWPYAKFGVKVAAVAPWFADTGIIPAEMKTLLVELPSVPLDRVAGAIVYAATEPDAARTGGCLYMLADGTSALLRFPPTATTAGVHAELAARLDAVFGVLAFKRSWARPGVVTRVSVIGAIFGALWIWYFGRAA